jgi:hypothetical protein
VRENRVIAGMAHNRWPSPNATMNKSAHVEMIAIISRRFRGFPRANMTCSPWLESSFGFDRRRLDALEGAISRSLRPWDEPELF